MLSQQLGPHRVPQCQGCYPSRKVYLIHDTKKPTSEISALHAAVSWKGDTSTCKSQEVLLSKLQGQGL